MRSREVEMNMSLPDIADAATRAQYPDEYWCVSDDGWVQYFWAEQTVSREEYLANSGKPDCV
jgi:hypothetical protein